MKSFGIKGLPNKEYFEIEEKGKDILIYPQDFSTASFKELKNIGAVFSPKEYRFTISKKNKKEVLEIIAFYTKQTEKISGSFLKMKKEIESKIGHLDMQFHRVDDKLVCVDPNMLCGEPSDIENLSKDMITSTFVEILNGVRIVFESKEKPKLF